MINPAAADSIRAADLAAVDDKDLLLTKATQRRGDYARIALGDADGYTRQHQGHLDQGSLIGARFS